MKQYFWKFELVEEPKDIFAHISLCSNSKDTLSSIFSKIESLFDTNNKATLMCSLEIPEELVLDSDKKKLYFSPKKLIQPYQDRGYCYRWDLSVYKNYKPYKEYWNSNTMICNYYKYNNSLNGNRDSNQDHALDSILLDFFKYLKLKSFA